jgi:Arc/MetJ-type ribon-helix-helix transcriptional regulator
MPGRIVVEINQQQAQLLDPLVEAGRGANYGEVIRAGFRAFCAAHPEILERGAADGKKKAKKRSKSKGAKRHG